MEIIQTDIITGWSIKHADITAAVKATKLPRRAIEAFIDSGEAFGNRYCFDYAIGSEEEEENAQKQNAV